ncbi:hypothetical protein B0H10DRAFT_2224905 [Mycena sp. CBHHK59/15]|nr:hypothetical protein B0H10DRAFT_2224905 [Mycena sp. CBHHK59/15]
MFENNNMLKTTLLLNSIPTYTVTTNLHGSITELRTAGRNTLVGRIRRNKICPNTITFPTVNGGRSMRLGGWFKRIRLADGSPAVVIKTEVGICFLRTHSVYRLALFSEDLQFMIAHWQPHTDPSSPITLVLLVAATETFCAQIIAAFLLEEQTMRKRVGGGPGGDCS